MTQKGLHTWDLVIEYHRCPKCGCINESRNGYSRNKDEWTKTVTCSRCGNQFVARKERKATFGPLIGDPQPIEIDWES